MSAQIFISNSNKTEMAVLVPDDNEIAEKKG